MDKKIRFSIIIPIYKVEVYLRECVDSVLNQSFQNIEVILVDDGSPDNCPLICDEYAEKDSRVKVIHQKNAGLSCARNAGLKEAAGEYVLFLDSDDYYDNENFLMRLDDKIGESSCQAVFFQWKRYFDQKNVIVNVCKPYTIDVLGEMSNDDKLLLLAEKDLLMASACSKAIRREYLVNNDLYFKAGIFSEDVEWFFRFARNLQSIELLNESCYCYRQREGSITRLIKKKNIEDVFYSIKTYAMDLKNSDLSKQKKKALLNYLAYQYFIVLGLAYSHLNKADRKEILNLCKEYKWLTAWAISNKTKKAALVVKLFGIRLGSVILGKYIQNK